MVAGLCCKATLCKTKSRLSSQHLQLEGKDNGGVSVSKRRLSVIRGRRTPCGLPGALQGERREKTLTKASSSPDLSTDTGAFPNMMKVSQPLLLSFPPHLLLSSSRTYFQCPSLFVCLSTSITLCPNEGLFRLECVRGTGYEDVETTS